MRFTSSRKAAVAAACALLLSGVVGIGAVVRAQGDSGSTSEHGPRRGSIVSSRPLYSLKTAQAAAAELRKAGFDDGTARYGVDAYRIVYRTLDAQGRPTTASGLLALPRTGRTGLHPVSFTHGTNVYKGDAPSTARADFVSAATISYAAAGFAGIAPDYLGLGKGPGPHPWMDLPSETTAAVDMLRAARTATRDAGHTLRPELMISGFSQGAVAGLGLGRALREDPHAFFRPAAMAPVSGPYDLAGTELPALLDGSLDPKSSTIYAGYTLVSVNRLGRDLYDDPREVFRAPYADGMDELFDHTHTGEEVAAGTPTTVDELLTAHGRALLARPTGSLARAVRVSDRACAGWARGATRVPTRLYMAAGDEQVATADTGVCRDALREHGARVPVVDLGKDVEYAGSRHLGSSAAATTATIAWFRELAARP